MDLSSLIFVALFVAWAVYLVPKALRHHEEDASSRSVEGFSDRLRVLARREAVSSTEAALVPATPTPAPRASFPRTSGSTSDVQRRLRQSAAARRAADRRRRVFNILLLAIITVAGLAVGKMVAWVWLAAPGGLMAAWLVACRLMVKRERAVRAAANRRRRRTLADEVIANEDAAEDETETDAEDDSSVGASVELSDDTDEIPVVSAQSTVGGWTPLPVPLPTYVTKAPAGRTVRTIDLDSTGVWSSGRNEADSRLAREADAQRAESEAAAEGEQRATGS